MDKYCLHANLIEKYLQKEAETFTRADIIKYIVDHKVEMVNFRYPAQDGRLKTLSFYIYSLEYLENILTFGERVDGSSLFSFIEASSSDLYVIPRYKTAFVNPFSEIPAVDILCSFYTSDGKPLESAPEFILAKAHKYFNKLTGLSFKALGELEFYVIAPKDNQFEPTNQKGYHESSPFIKYNDFRNQAMRLISQCGGKIKYGHSEVGAFSDENYIYEQHEIEFLPVPVEQAADQILIAKWVLRNLAYKQGISVSFAPKITVGKAGSGMHIHMLAEKDGHNQMLENGNLSEVARKMIAGILSYADALTAFGNTTPLSYMRLVPHQEAPTNICWGDRNRSALIRVPLGWTTDTNMTVLANPNEQIENHINPEKQTIELRSPDGTADVYYLLAGIVIAAAQGFIMPNALEIADKLYVSVNIHKENCDDKAKQLGHLPSSCVESAKALAQKRTIFETENIFPSGTIDYIINTLSAFEDTDLREKLQKDQNLLNELVLKNLNIK
ncbi:MAG: glutamine synthetase family protein [Bacteroidales bacterium]